MDHVQPGQMLGPYRVISQIGQGGMATVYKAYHAAMDRYVALKVLSPEFARSEEFKGRFQQEAHIIANLEHKHILPVHDFGESDGVHYFVMRFLDTGTLKDRIKSGALTLAEIDRLFSQLAEALGYAHQCGVIHRDIKPANILIDAHGDAFLTDFGIAKLAEGTLQLTATGSVTGTPAYMSPEQAQGEKLDARTDIYSLGIMLYEMVTGCVPFDADTPLAVMLKHVNASLPLPSKVKPDVHPRIERVLLKALAKDRDDRFATCREFLTAWKSAYQAATIPGQPAATLVSADAPASGTINRAGLPVSRRTLAFIAAGVIGLALMVVAGLIIGSRIIAPTPKTTVPSTSVVQATPAGSVTPSETTVEPTQPTGTTATPMSMGGGKWTSWVGGNIIFLVSVGRDHVFTAGQANVTIWNRKDGSIVRRLTSTDGIPGSREMNALLAESDDSVWIGTNEGLFHYDGQALTPYGIDDGLDSNVIRSILRLRDDRLLVGTYSSQSGNGLNVFDGTWFSAWKGFPSLSVDENPDALSSDVRALAEGLDGTLWVGTTTGLGRWDGTTWTQFTTADGLPSNYVIRLLATHDGNILIGTEKGSAIYAEQKIQALPEDIVPRYYVYGLAEDSAGRYWFSGPPAIWRYDPTTTALERYDDGNTRLLTYDMYGAATDAAGNLYFGSEGNGLIVFDKNLNVSAWQVPDVPSSADYDAILLAPNGRLWFSRAGEHGIDIFNPQTAQWEGAPKDLRGHPMLFDAQGKLWAKDYPTGFWIVAPDGAETHITERQGLPPDTQVREVAFGAGGEIWLGTTAGIALFDGAQVGPFFKTADTGLGDDRILAMCAASDGSLWVSSGTHASLARRKPDGTWESFGSGNPLHSDIGMINDIAEDKSGAIWVATSWDGVYRYAKGEWTQFTYADPGVKLPSPHVRAITLADDSLWFSTDAGAARFDGTTWTAFTQVGPEALISSVVQDIYVDSTATVYFATDGGITQWKP